MKRYKLLILTDHSGHNEQNSLYALARTMQAHPRALGVDVATRGEGLNRLFFEGVWTNEIYATPVHDDFYFSENGDCFKQGLRKVALREYDAIWLRLPPPIESSFLFFLKRVFDGKMIFNNPVGIYKTGTKAFLMGFPKLCPPMVLCENIQDINYLREKYPIVLKPLRGYGGKGIIRIDGDRVWIGATELCYSDFIESIRGEKIEFLCVKYLEHVGEGDKRIVVVDGKIIGASLRKPAEGSWLCNAAMGGSSHSTKVDKAEIKIIKKINPTLSKMGIVMYGVDTLMGDKGKRVLSEINTTSIGGVMQIDEQRGGKILPKIAHRLWKNIHKQIKNRKDVIEQG